MSAAASATTARRAGTAANVIGSTAVTPNTQRRHEASERERAGEAGDDAGAGDGRSLADDRTEDLAGPRAERHPHADFAPSRRRPAATARRRVRSPASARAVAANRASSSVLSRCCDVDSVSVSASVRTEYTARRRFDFRAALPESPPATPPGLAAFAPGNAGQASSRCSRTSRSAGRPACARRSRARRRRRRRCGRQTLAGAPGLASECPIGSPPGKKRSANARVTRASDCIAPGLLVVAGVALQHRNVKRLEIPRRSTARPCANVFSIGPARRRSGTRPAENRRRPAAPDWSPRLRRQESASSRATVRRWRATTASSAFGPGGAHAERLHVCPDRIPATSSCSRAKLRISSPAPISRTIASATCAGDQDPLHERAVRRRVRVRRVRARRPDSVRAAWSAGAIANSSVVSSPRPIVNGDQAGVDANVLNARQASPPPDAAAPCPSARRRGRARIRSARGPALPSAAAARPSRATRPGRSATASFVLAPSRFGQQQAGDVAARGEQHQRDGARQEPQRSPDASDLLFFQRRQRRAPALVGLRKLLAETRLNRGRGRPAPARR